MVTAILAKANLRITQTTLPKPGFYRFEQNKDEGAREVRKFFERKPNEIIQGVSAKTFGPNNSVIFQRIFVKFKMQIF
jgi:hypothetical protein